MKNDNVALQKDFVGKTNAEYDWWVFPSYIDTHICKKIISIGENNWKDAKITNSLQSDEQLDKSIRDTKVTRPNNQSNNKFSL